MVISFNFQKKIILKRRRGIKNVLIDIFNKEGKDIKDLSIIFCDDAFLLEINKKYLNHNYFTDIITFNLSGKEDNSITADMYISIERIAENAKKYKISFSTELNRVMIHGVLHLCGYKDTSRKKALMRDKEDFYLQFFK